MPRYRIADLCLEITPATDFTQHRLKPYLTDADTADEVIDITDDDLAFERRLASQITDGVFEYTAILRKICHMLLNRYDGLFLHAATIVYDGKAYAFTAPSGTGKTTHCRLWQRVLGADKVRFLNGDKLLLRVQNGRFIAYGNPWQGKEDLGENLSCELGGIFVLSRAEQNSAHTLRPIDALRELLKATVFPDNDSDKLKLLDRLDALIKTVDVCALHVNMEDDAVHTALSRIQA